MYDGGYRPDRGFNKCARVVGDVMGKYHPHGDSAIYDALVRLAQTGRCATRCRRPGQLRLAGQRPARPPCGTPSAGWPRSPWRWCADIDEDTVDFRPNYDGRTQEPDRPAEPLPQPARQRLGRASRSAWPPTSRRTTCARSPTARQWTARATPRPRREELLDALLSVIKGPDFPTGALIMGRQGIEDAYRTGRGSIIMRAVVEIEEVGNRAVPSSSPSCPTRSTPTCLALKIAELVKDGKISGIADIRDETSGRTGQRLVIVLKRDAVAKVVLNNLYKHTQLQTNFGANMLALVDGVPRTLPLDGVHPALGRPPDRGHPAGARSSACARPRPTSTSCAACSRRSTCSTRSSPSSGRSRTVEAARDGLIELLEHRRDPGQRDPRHAAAPPRRPRAPEDQRRPRRAAGR